MDMNDFSSELRDLIDKWRDMPGHALEEIIDAIEPTRRGPYGGAVGYFDSRGNFDAAILIRTLVIGSDGKGSVQTGAGIVWDSDPQAEDEECLAKAEAILRAVGGAQG
jgi:anthranilate synthase component 1